MNPVVHFEVPMEDKSRAMKFYAETFGWKLQDMPEMHYVMAMTAEKASAPSDQGFGAISGGMAMKGILTAPSFAIDVPDIDAAVEKVKAAGGTIIKEKVDVGGMGWMVYFKDTEGNILSLWQSVKKA